MWYINTNKKKKKKESLGVNRKGFVLVYGLLLFQVVFVFTSMIVQKVKTNTFIQKEEVAMVELYAIQKAKLDLKEYEEQDETITYLGYEVTFLYEDITCYISIRKGEKQFLQSVLVYDDVDLQVADYYYT